MANKNMDLMESSAKVRLGTSDKIIRGFGYAFVTFYAICCIIPFIIIVSSSFTSERFRKRSLLSTEERQ